MVSSLTGLVVFELNVCRQIQHLKLFRMAAITASCGGTSQLHRPQHRTIETTQDFPAPRSQFAQPLYWLKIRLHLQYCLWHRYNNNHQIPSMEPRTKHNFFPLRRKTNWQPVPIATKQCNTSEKSLIFTRQY
jgi:hypothetical protein